MSDIARLIPRLSTTERLILDLLREGELFGLQLVDRSDGALKRGTVYVTLGRMEAKGLVESQQEPVPPGGCPGVSTVRPPSVSECGAPGRRSHAKWRGR